jgi:hypothetical protein
MRNLAIAGLIAGLTVGLFLADARNRTSLTTVLENAAAAKPAMQGVAFRIPFVPDPPKATPKPTLYPPGFDWLEGYVMKYYEIGEGYWQTRPLDLLNGVEITNEDVEEYRGHFRFKFNPPNDPLHPGHAMVATNSEAHTIRFAHLRGGDFDALEQIPEHAFKTPFEGELAAAWTLEAGDTIGIRLDSTITVTESEATGSETVAQAAETEASPKPSKPRVEHRITYAKLYIRKLSHNDVQFDYLHRTDGKKTFPRPNRAAQP